MDSYINPERVVSVMVTHPRYGSELIGLINPAAGAVGDLARAAAAKRWGVSVTEPDIHDSTVEEFGAPPPADLPPMLQLTCIKGHSYSGFSVMEPCPVCEHYFNDETEVLKRRYRHILRKKRKPKAK